MPGPGTWSAGDILTAADLNAIGTWTTYTPTLTQSGTRTATVNHASYCQINKMVVANFDLTCTTTGSAGSNITVSLPVTASGNGQGFGAGFFWDDSATNMILISARVNSTTTVNFYAEQATVDTTLGINPSLALGTDDVVSCFLVYTAA